LKIRAQTTLKLMGFKKEGGSDDEGQSQGKKKKMMEGKGTYFMTAKPFARISYGKISTVYETSSGVYAMA